MIPVLFTPSATVFTSNGLGRLIDCISAEVYEERNGAFELDITMPVSGRHFKDITYGSIITAKPSPGRSAEPFEVYSITTSSDGMQAVIRAEHISYRLSRIPVLPFTASGASAALSGLISHSVENNPFSTSTDVSTAGTYTLDVPASCRSQLMGVQGSILQKFGGEYKFTGYNVQLLASRGQNRGQSIRYGKNLISLEQEKNIQETITGVLGYWTGTAEGSDQEEVVTMTTPVYSSNAGNYPYKRTVPIDFSSDFDEKPTVSQLTTRAQQYIQDNKIGEPRVSLDVEFAALEKTTAYKEIAHLETAELCDTLDVVYPTLDVRTTAKVTIIRYDVLRERYITIHIGSFSPSLASTIVSAENQIEQGFKQQSKTFTTLVNKITELINGSLDGSAMITLTDSDGRPQGLVFMDTQDQDTAQNCIRMNIHGIGFSTSGVNGPYETAIYYDPDLGQWVINSTFLNVINLIVSHLRSYDSNQTTLLDSMASYLDIRGWDAVANIWRQRVGLFKTSSDSGALRISSGNVDENGSPTPGETSRRSFLTANYVSLGVDENGTPQGYIATKGTGTALATTPINSVSGSWTFDVDNIYSIVIEASKSGFGAQTMTIPIRNLSQYAKVYGMFFGTDSVTFECSVSNNQFTLTIQAIASGITLISARGII